MPYRQGGARLGMMLESLHLQTGFHGQFERKTKIATESLSENEMEMYKQELIS